MKIVCTDISSVSAGDIDTSVFEKYGNFSSPSVMFVLETWFKDAKRPLKDEKTRGCAISFGAGYFMGGMTYHWSKK